MLRSTVKLTMLAVSLSMITSGCALADWAKHFQGEQNASESKGLNTSHLSSEEKQKLEEEIEADKARLAAEKQAMLEMSLMHEVGNINLQFKPLLSKLYADNQYQLFWTDKAAERQLLKDYAALVVSGISTRASVSLENLAQAEIKGGITYDVALTDIFLDYLYYTKNVVNQAQSWLYSTKSYNPQSPAENDVAQWISAVKNNQNLNFVQNLSGKNSHYKQTVQMLSSMISASGITDTGRKLAINAQRLRMIPDFNNGIFVNIPSYQLQYYRNNQLTLESRVIVGKDSRRTPVMYSKLSNIVVNPPWNAPVRLINEDIVPKLRANPGYAAAHRYTILDAQGRSVDPYSINWSSIGKRFPYHIRQEAGGSALGNYKFNMPSSDAIYLHDTPNHALFNRKDRALSSGCVRVEKSDQLATILLKEAGWTEERKRSTLASKKTVSAPIRSDNPVYLYYVTSWAENGKIHTLPDIYRYDGLKSTQNINWAVVKKYL